MTTTPLALIFPDDTILPSAIHHEVDEAWHPRAGSNEPGKLAYRYNFLRYEFHTPSGVVHARAYLDQIKRVSIHLVAAQRAEPLLADIQNYFKRRFGKVEIQSN
jgi:hypothetical protein